MSVPCRIKWQSHVSTFAFPEIQEKDLADFTQSTTSTWDNFMKFDNTNWGGTFQQLSHFPSSIDSNRRPFYLMQSFCNW